MYVRPCLYTCCPLCPVTYHPAWHSLSADAHLHAAVPTASVAQNTCGSTEAIGVNLYLQTDNVSESEQRVVPSGEKRQQTGQIFEVPLHDNNQQYTTMSTGLIRVQAESVSKGLADWFAVMRDPDYPPMEYPDHAFWSASSGCPLSVGANRTYYLATGSYILETMGADLAQECTNFIVSALCTLV